MKEIKSGKQFKKDLKKFANQPKKLMELYYFIDNYLRTGATIPEKYRAHMLHGHTRQSSTIILKKEWRQVLRKEENNCG